MKNLSDYIDLAKSKSCAKNYSALADMLDISHVMISQMRSGKSLPADELMIRIADIAGIDHETALLDLNVWKSSGVVRNAYAKILHNLSRAAMMIFAASVVLLSSHAPSSAANYAEKCKLDDLYNLYYGIYALFISN